MATKKEKRAAALAKREKFLDEQRTSGLAALEASRAHEQKITESVVTRLNALSDRMEESLKAEIIAMSEQFGERVRLAEDNLLDASRRAARSAWTEFLIGLDESPHRDAAVSAYNSAYSRGDEHDCPSWCVVHRVQGERSG